MQINLNAVVHVLSYAVAGFGGAVVVVVVQNFQSKRVMKNELALGKKLRCIVTGFEGIATARIEYLNGCVQYLIKPKAIDGKMVDGEYIDRQQLEVADQGVAITPNRTGGPATDAPKRIGMARN